MYKFIILFLLVAQSMVAQNSITAESFSGCTVPQHWVLKTDAGTYGFSIQKSSLFPPSETSCSMMYQQGQNGDNSTRKFSARTAEYPLFAYDQYVLSFGLRFTRTNASSVMNLSILVDGIKQPLKSYSADVVQTGTVLVTQSFNLNLKPANKNIQLLFEYEAPGNDFNTVILVDNIALSGPDNDDCARAVELQLDQACLPGNSNGALFTGPAIQCNGTYNQGMWYTYTSSFTGLLKIQNIAAYNDAVSVFQGSCAALNSLSCHNSDEYGFEGESAYVPVEAGKNYYFRIVKQTGYYGREDLGELCISIAKKDPTRPLNDGCTEKKLLTINAPCLREENIAATFSAPVPSLNEKSRADVWYSFKTTSTKSLEIVSHADFADVLTLYKGNCAQLTEVQCEDLGGKLILNNPSINTEYFIQVSGYFSSLEGHLCLEVLERGTQKPEHDDCLTSKAIILNQGCTASTTINSIKSNIRSSCVVYAAPDVWYSFVAPAEKSVTMLIQSDFIYNWAVYSGSCASLVEFSCGKTPDPCQGPFIINGLTAGKTYYLQIQPAAHPLAPAEGNLCVEIDESSKAPVFNPLQLELLVECLHGVLGKVSYQASGGQGLLSYNGPSDSEWFKPGTQIEAFIEDENGCRDFDKLTIDCQAPQRCTGSNLDLSVQTDCLTDSLGRQTGEVIFHIQGQGGSGAYFYYGTPDGTKLKHGDDYQVVLIDSDSCYIIEEGRINCPPFDCSQSNLSVKVNYDCIDTLLKARIRVEVSGPLGTFTIKGHQDGDLLNTGSIYKTEVVDEAGCSSETTGQIICHFDSCAYARPTLEVTYDCVADTNGNQTGLAVMHVKAGSYAGGLSFSGPRDGDTLKHQDRYLVQMTDAFGCTLTQSGEIVCIPVKNNEAARSGQISYYPNPVDQQLTMQFRELTDSELRLRVYTHDGRLIDQKRLTRLGANETILLNTGSYPNGILYIKLEGEHFFHIIRVSKH